MIPIQNQEHIEAIQDATNKRNDEFKVSLSEEDRNKFEAIEKCFDILRENNVSAFIFPILPTPEGKLSCYQYNNALEFIKFTKSGQIEPESKRKLNIFNSLFIHCAFIYTSEVALEGAAFTWDLFCRKVSDIIQKIKNTLDHKGFYDKN